MTLVLEAEIRTGGISIELLTGNIKSEGKKISLSHWDPAKNFQVLEP